MPFKNSTEGLPHSPCSYKKRKEKIRLRIIDGMDSICRAKGEAALKKAEYYDSYDFSATDPDGSYTGVPSEPNTADKPVQDADDL